MPCTMSSVRRTGNILRCQGSTKHGVALQRKQAQAPASMLQATGLSWTRRVSSATRPADHAFAVPATSTISDSMSVRLPGTDLKVSRVGFGSPWMAAAADRSESLSRALGNGRCNLVQLSSRVMPASDRDGEGKVVSREGDEAGDAAESWEARTIRGLEIPRRDLALVLTLEGAGLPVEGALDPHRVLDQLDVLLHYHGLEYLDSLMLEIPALKGGEGAIDAYRRDLGAGLRRTMEIVPARAGDRISSLGFAWEGATLPGKWSQELLDSLSKLPVNPHAPYPGRSPHSPLSDIVDVRNVVTPSMPVVAMFPVGVACGATMDGWDSGASCRFGLPAEQGVFQIGTRVLHAQRPDGRPFRLVDVDPRPVDEIMSDLKSRFNMAIHLEMEYAKRFEGRQGTAGDVRDDGGDQGEGEGEGEADRGKASSTEADRLEGPLPDKVDVSWAHILVQHQHQLQGLDEWEMIRDGQIKPTVNRAVQILKAAGKASGEWGFLYRSTLGSLLGTMTEVMQVRKKQQLSEVAALMDELCPSLQALAGPEADGRTGAEGSGASVMERCVGVALATGVDCVLSEEYVSSGTAERQDLLKVSNAAHLGPGIAGLYSGFRLPE